MEGELDCFAGEEDAQAGEVRMHDVNHTAWEDEKIVGFSPWNFKILRRRRGVRGTFVPLWRKAATLHLVARCRGSAVNRGFAENRVSSAARSMSLLGIWGGGLRDCSPPLSALFSKRECLKNGGPLYPYVYIQ